MVLIYRSPFSNHFETEADPLNIPYNVDKMKLLQQRENEKG